MCGGIDRQAVETQLHSYAQRRDCRDLMAAHWAWNDLLERHGDGPKIRRSKRLAEEALTLALSAVCEGDA